MSRDRWRCTDIVEVPHIVGLHIRDAERAAYAAGLKLAQPDPDGSSSGSEQHEPGGPAVAGRVW